MYTLLHTSAHRLDGIPSHSIHTVITSPPYYGLRDYDGDHDIAWSEVSYAPMAGLPLLTIPAMQCALGHEPSVEAYIGHLILCLREWRRVLRTDGTAWVVLGDTSAGSNGVGYKQKRHSQNVAYGGEEDNKSLRTKTKRKDPVPAKNFLGVPWRFAFAAQADGWHLRRDGIWAKAVSFAEYSGSSFPESVKDRPSTAHEYFFLLSPQRTYFYDVNAVREPLRADSVPRRRKATTADSAAPIQDHKNLHVPGREAHSLHKKRARGQQEYEPNEAGRQLRSVWRISPRPFSEAHFATFPVDLVEPMVRLTTSAGGCCQTCGAPYKRTVETEGAKVEDFCDERGYSERAQTDTAPQQPLHYAGNHRRPPRQYRHVGWQPICKCDLNDPMPCNVLDPFNGAGTTALAALQLGRTYYGSDLSQTYLDLTVRRLRKLQLTFAEIVTDAPNLTPVTPLLGEGNAPSTTPVPVAFIQPELVIL